MIAYKIDEIIFEKVCETINGEYPFDSDGCLCGSFNFKVEDNIYIHIHRSCHKSNSIPNDMNWFIHKPQLCERIPGNDEYDEMFIELDFEIIKEQREILLGCARKKCIEEIGYDEYGKEAVR